MRPLVTPDVLRETVDRHSMPPRREKDLEHLLRPDASQISAGPIVRPAALDRERAEEADHRPFTALPMRLRSLRFASTTDMRSRVYRTTAPLGRTTSHRPPNSLTF